MAREHSRARARPRESNDVRAQVSTRMTSPEAPPSMPLPHIIPQAPEFGRPAIWLARCPSASLAEQRQRVDELLQSVFDTPPFRAAARPTLMHDPQGRPTLSEPYAALPISIAHTPGVVAVAVGTPGQYIGVDVEFRHRQVRKDRIAARVFSAAEQSHAETSPGAFWAIWTRKEALLKALGLGLGDTDWSRYDTGDPGGAHSTVTLPHALVSDVWSGEAIVGHLWVDELCVGWACRPRTT